MASAVTVGEVAAPAAAIATEQVNACGAGDAGLQNNIFGGYSTFGIAYVQQCGIASEGLILKQDGVNTENPGQVAGWVANVPAGLAIVSADVPALTVNNVVGTGYLAYISWNGGGGPDRVAGNGTFDSGIPPSSSFSFLLECNPSGTTCPADGADLNVQDVQLTVAETVDPAITPIGTNNLWYKGASEYVRGGGWSAAYSASAPSGILSMVASENGVQVGVAPDSGWCPSRSYTVWQQCPGTGTFSPTVALSGSGDQMLSLSAESAALNLSSTPPETLHVDSVQPTVTLSGPTDASSADGTQYITATAIAGTSGVQGISCSLDNAPAEWHTVASEQIAVSGIGQHTLTCRSENNSYDSSGQANWSTPATWTLSIREPSLSAASFSRIAGKLKCGKVREREKIPAHLVKVRRRGRLILVRRRAKTVVRRVVRCHPRVIMKRICHAGHCKKQRTIVLPHTVQQSTWRARFGKGATVSGWLGTAGGVPLAGQQVQVMTAPDNGSNAFTQAAMITTAADGTWTAALPAGPSRLVEAVYGGASTIEPASSGQIHLIVPAKVKLSIRPRRVRWGRTIRITGRVLGGYIPAGKLLRLRIGVSGVRETVGIPNIAPDGRFQTTWKFAQGNGVVRYWFSVSTLNEADYPFAPGSSRRVYVKVGPR